MTPAAYGTQEFVTEGCFLQCAGRWQGVGSQSLGQCLHALLCDRGFQPEGGLSALLCVLVNAGLDMIAMGTRGRGESGRGGKGELEPPRGEVMAMWR